MVESQIRTNKVTDQRVITAFEAVPRELFVDEAKRGFAYVDEDLEVAVGRYLMEPMVLARLLQAAAPQPGDIVLDIGCASGYSAAVLARLADSVVALESDEALAAQASETLVELGIDNVAVVAGSLEEGYPSEGPYDVIFVGGAIETVPSGLLDQLKDGGRLVAVVGYGRAALATLYTKSDGDIGSRPEFDADVRPLPGFRKAKAFVF